MNAKRIMGLSLLIVSAMVAVAAAAPGTNKARGIYNRGGWESSGGPARHRYTQRAPATYHAPIVRATPAPQVAQAPVEGRRFSYAPADQAVTWSPCPPVTSVESGRRYSYAPSTGAAVVPQASAPRVYYSQPRYSTGRRSTGHRDLWALPKTDPRKYSSR
jgi:hypothetical protein